MKAPAFLLCALTFSGGILSSSCSKDTAHPHVIADTPDSSLTQYFPPGRNVYMVGQLGGGIVCWKNGIKTVLDHNGRPTCMALDEGDLLVGGMTIKDQSDQLAVYWKNGEKQQLTDTLTSIITGVHKWKGDIYASGYMFDREPFEAIPPKILAVYWKNGDSVTLSPGVSAVANGFDFSGDDMYVAGQLLDNRSAVVWKNGELRDYGTQGMMYGVLKRSSDIYFLGVFAGPPVGNYSLARLFKNDDLVSYDTLPGGANAYLVGDDVYLVGSTNDSTGHSQAAYWKNGHLKVLSTTHQSSRASGLAVSGNDLFIVGSFQFDGNETAVFWKNDEEVIVERGGNLVAIVSE